MLPPKDWKRWNNWRKRDKTGWFHHILVLLEVIHSPTFEMF